jgi:hypothetical protein
MPHRKIQNAQDEAILQWIFKETRRSRRPDHASTLVSGLRKAGFPMKNGKNLPQLPNELRWIAAAWAYPTKVLKDKNLVDRIAHRWLDSRGQPAWKR